MKRTLIVCFGIMMFLNSAAITYAQSVPVIFTRETISISHKENAQTPHQFNVEVRPEDALRLDYIQALTTLNDTNGVMIGFNAPTIVPLPYFRVQQATDVLFVDNAGVILQIYPGHIPIELTQEIYADNPIKALIYLKAGIVKSLGIRPRDVVKSAIFSPPPPLLQ